DSRGSTTLRREKELHISRRLRPCIVTVLLHSLFAELSQVRTCAPLHIRPASATASSCRLECVTVGPRGQIYLNAPNVLIATRLPSTTTRSAPTSLTARSTPPS